jgi:hypothetical protein
MASNGQTPLDGILPRLQKVRKTNQGYEALCPAHDDGQRRSLTIACGTDGRVLVRCHGNGCSAEAIVGAIGLQKSDLFPKHGNGRPGGSWGERTAATYDYHDAHGDLLFQVVRLREPKEFRQRRPSGDGGWIWNLNGVTPVLYRLPRLRAAVAAGETIYVVEGEKDVHTLADWGLTATTNPMGARKWRPSYSAELRGAAVVILPDNDDDGAKHAESVARSLGGQATTIKIVPLPHLPPKGDVTDWREAGGTKEALEVLVAATPVYEPGPDDAAERNGGFVDFVDIAETSAPTEWTPPTPFHSYDLPEFPVDTLPRWLAEFVTGVARATQTPPDLAALLSLAAVAVATQRTLEVQARPGWREPLSLYTVISLPPGSRKTAVFKAATGPLEEREVAEGLRQKPEIAAAETRAKILEGQLQKVQQAAARTENPTERETLAGQAEELAAELALFVVPHPTRYILDDSSPERLAMMLGQQGGRLAVMSDEGGVFEIMAGRYSGGGGPNIDVYLKAHAGGTIRVDRIGRPADYILRPALTVGLAVQPDVICGLSTKPGFRGRGLLGRFLFSLPRSTLGSRQVDAPALAEAVRAEYHENLTSLLETCSVPTDSSSNGDPIVLTMTPEAREFVREMECWLEPRLAEFGELGMMTDWAGKLIGHVVRLAGLLHMASLVGHPEPWAVPISVVTTANAAAIGHYLIPHARAAYAEMGNDPQIEEAKHVLAWILKERPATFSKRDVFSDLRGRFKKVESMEPSLHLLCEHGYLREQEQPPRRGPGRPSVTYEVNPLVLAQNPQNPQNPVETEIEVEI